MRTKTSTAALVSERGTSAALVMREQHHPFGPSKWPAILACPNFRSRPPTEATKRGSELHAVFEAVMRGEYGGEPEDSLELNVVNAARTILRTANPTLGRFYVEEVVWLPGPGGLADDSGIYGRPDLAWIDAETLDLHVLDLKLAPGRDYRAQLLAYAAGMARHLSLTGPRNVVLHMLYADSGAMTEETLSMGDAMSEYLVDYRRVAAVACGEVGRERPCTWCDLCSRFTDCGAMKAVVDKAAPRLEDAANPQRWAEYPAERKARLCALADALGKWCAAVKENAAADAKAGEVIEDPDSGVYYGIQERKGRLVISDVLAAWELLKPHLSAEGYMACLSVNQAELKAALKQAGMKLSDVNALVERCGTRLPSTTVFVRKGLKESA